jgi:hypothetical protein
VTTTPRVEVADLFDRHGRAVQRYLRAATGSAEVAEDLAQDVFVRVVRCVGRYEPRERARARGCSGSQETSFWIIIAALPHDRRAAAWPLTAP